MDTIDAKEKPMDTTESGIPRICLYPKEISQQFAPATHTMHCQRVILGSSIPLSDHQRLLDACWGRVAKPVVSPLTPVPPPAS